MRSSELVIGKLIPCLENTIPSQGVLTLIGGIRGRWPMVDLTRVYGTSERNIDTEGKTITPRFLSLETI